MFGSNIKSSFLFRKCFRFFSIACLMYPLLGFSAASANGMSDKTESPYFAVNGGDSKADSLPLKGTEVDVRIVGVIAEVSIKQRYKNEGKTPLEARYVFPGSTRAAVYGMEVELGNRRLTAKIKEREQAKKDYEQAKSEGKTSALLEQQRESVFQMNVANIMPGDDVLVTLRYTELMVPNEGKYQFVFPTVVGPRYNGRAGRESHKSEKWISTPYQKEGVPPSSEYKISVNLISPTGVVDVKSPSHRVVAKEKSESEIRIEMDQDTKHANNRDFILDYTLSGEKITSGLVLTRGEDENFFLAMVEPPKRVAPEEVVPREYIFVVDVSGSMHGFPIDTAKILMNNLLGRLRPRDSFNVMTFSGGNALLSPKSLQATPENIALAYKDLNQYQGGGSTELLPALRAALKLPADTDRSRTFVIVTDGFVSVESEAFSLIRNNLDQANLFALGIGSSVNRMLIEGMARAGQGESFVVTKPEEADATADKLLRMIESPVLTHIKARFEGLDIYDVEPKSMPDVFSERPVILFGKWRGNPAGKLIVEGKTARGNYQRELPVQVSTANNVLRNLWARHKIAALSDDESLMGSGSMKKEIVSLGLKYSLLSQYTSFIAIDEIVRNEKTAESVSVDQPSPLPEGVSNNAVGSSSNSSGSWLSSFSVASTPEPESWAMLMISLAGMFYAGHRRRMRAIRKPLSAIGNCAVGILKGEADLPEAAHQVNRSMQEMVVGVFDLPQDKSAEASKKNPEPIEQDA